MKMLMIGDIVGRPGRRVVKELLPAIKKEHQIDFVMANGENSAGGRGISREVMNELLDAGIEVITMGNHVWDNKEIMGFIDDEPRLVRPLNYPGDCPGRGSTVVPGPGGYRMGVINLSGRVFLANLDCPFRVVDLELQRLRDRCDIIVIDLHAEATSEKQAFGWYVDSRVNAVFGTHTHVQTSDETILPGGTAYITDVGMTGPRHSVLGMKTDLVIKRFLEQRPVSFEVAKGDSHLEAVVVEFSDSSPLRTTGIYRIREIMEV